ncbi:MAG: GDP-L-fucose synthase, partial [Candidatus Korobacteraceae bacterium]
MNNAFAGARVFVAGHRGLAGSAILRRLQAEGSVRLITRPHAELELTDALAVERFFAAEQPEAVFLCAAKVGGILANSTKPAEFISQNLAIQTNVIDAAYRHRVKRLLFLGSSCIYPRECPQPMKESYLLSGPLESTNQSYAVAKIAGIEMCRAYNRQYGTQFLAAMPTNLYGPNDNYDPQDSHVLPALIRKMHMAKQNGEAEVTVWGTGRVRREFLHSDDMASACVFLMSLPEAQFRGLTAAEPPLINVGCGEDMEVGELAKLVAEVVGFSGKLAFDSSKPDGSPRKLLDISLLNSLGWKPMIPLRRGVESVY